MTQLLDVQEFAAALGVRPRTVYKWTSGRMVPFVKLGKVVRFHPRTVEAIQDGTLQIDSGQRRPRVRKSGRIISRIGASIQPASF